MKQKVAIVACLILVVACCAWAAVHKFGPYVNAIEYNYGGSGNAPQAGIIYTGTSTPAGGTSITLTQGYVTLNDGYTLLPYSVNCPITVGVGAVAETITPSGVSSCNIKDPSGIGQCVISYSTTFTYAHSAGDRVASGTYGLCEAVQDAKTGKVLLDNSWYLQGGTKTMITNIVSATPKVWIEDDSNLAPVLYGKSGTTTAAYSSTNNDQVFQLTESGGTGTKSFSQTYAASPQCVATINGNANAAWIAAVNGSSVTVNGNGSSPVNVRCALQE